ncbi:MAG: UDP-N-acetylglucosamine 2-epimerase (hydrolyzing), partial [Alphaproteobacteria bacterium]
MSASAPRLIACMTATRADYPRVKSVLQEIERRPALSLQLIVTGAHLREEYGMTVREIEADGFPIAARVAMYDGDDTPVGMARAAARCAGGMVDALDKI